MNKSKQSRHREIENTYTTTITYECPTRGWVTEEIEVKRYEGTKAPNDIVMPVLVDDIN